MYKSFFKLEEKPFNLTPDPRYLYLNENHREVLASLKYGISQKRGFIVITGEVGTGKTTHLFNFLEGLGERTVSAFIFNPILNREEFFQYIFDDFDLPPGARTKTDYLKGLNRFLLEQAEKKVTTVLVIDEAQNLSSDILEEVRLLSNLETTREKLLQIVLVGQPELDEKLQTESLRQLQQRISIRGRILPLSRGETGEFIRHRLKVAGYAGEVEIFDEAATALIARLSSGIPRVINNICDNVLLSCYALGRKKSDPEIILEVAADLDIDGPQRPQSREKIPGDTATAVTDIRVLEDAAEPGDIPEAAAVKPAAAPLVVGPVALARVEEAEPDQSTEPEPMQPGGWVRSAGIFQSFINRLKVENE